MEEIRERIIELDLPNALLKASNPERIKRYLANIMDNAGILQSIVLRHFDRNKTNPIPPTDLSPKERSVLQLMNILFTIEGSLAGIINLVIYALVVNRHDDIFNSHNHEFASSFEDILSINLGVKLKFLEKHGFKFLAETCPRDIRNMFAHGDFIIDEDGSIGSITNERPFYSLLQLTHAVLKMNDMIMKITDVWAGMIDS